MKYLTTYICAALALITVSVAHAEDEQRPEKRMGANMEARIDARVEMRNERRDVRVEGRQEFKTEIKADLEKMREGRREMWQDWKNGASTTKEEMKEKMKMFRDEVKNDIKDRRMEVKARIASSTKEIKARFDENKKERVKERLVNVQGKFDAALTRLEGFDVKVEAAIEKFDDNNVDVTTAQDLLAAAREEPENTKGLVAEFKTKAEAIVDGDEVSRLALKEEAQVVVESIKATHAAYVDVLAELKASGTTVQSEVKVEASN